MATLDLDDLTKQRIIPPFVDKLFQLNGFTNVFKLKSGAKTTTWDSKGGRRTAGDRITGTQFVATGLWILYRGSKKFDEWSDLHYGTERQANNVKKILGAPGARAKIETIELVGKPKGSNIKELVNISITQLDKSGAKEFQASGSGGGASTTELAEGGACIALAWLLDPISKGKDLKYDDFVTPAKRQILLTNLDQRVDLGAFETKDGMNKILDFFMEEPDWLDTSIKTAQKLKAKLKLSYSHHMHRDSAFMRGIYLRARKEIKESPGLQNALQALTTDKSNPYKLSIGGDKWNPGDIWIAEGFGNKGFPATQDSNTLSHLNKEVLDKFHAADIMGISLKKIGKSVQYQIYNASPSDARFDGFTYTGIKDELPAKLMDSKDMYVEGKYHGKNQLLQIRTFDADSNIQTELKGGAAAAGKAGFGVVDFAMKTFKQEALLTYPTINKMTEADKMKLVQDYYKQIFGRSVSDREIRDSLDKKKNRKSVLFANWSERHQNDYWTSKIEALQICAIINKNKDTDLADNIITVIMAYAMSLGLGFPSKAGLETVFRASTYAKVF